MVHFSYQIDHALSIGTGLETLGWNIRELVCKVGNRSGRNMERREMDKNHPRQQLGLEEPWRGWEEKEKSDKMTWNDFLPPPPRIQLNQGPDTIILSHTGFRTSTERYDNFVKIIYVCVAMYRTKTDSDRQRCFLINLTRCSAIYFWYGNVSKVAPFISAGHKR